jgi:hypothetical protein
MVNGEWWGMVGDGEWLWNGLYGRCDKNSLVSKRIHLGHLFGRMAYSVLMLEIL